MISGKVLKASFLLNRHWTIEQIKSGLVASTVAEAMSCLSKDEMDTLKDMEAKGTFLPINN